MLPGRRIVLAGCGPLLLLVASKVLAAGGAIVAIADLAGPADWLATLPRVLRRPGLAMRGAGWAVTIGRARVPVHFRHGVRAATGRDRVRARRDRPGRSIGAPAAGSTIALEADALAVGHGLVPGAEIPRLAPRRHDLRSPARRMGAAGGRIRTHQPSRTLCGRRRRGHPGCRAGPACGRTRRTDGGARRRPHCGRDIRARGRDNRRASARPMRRSRTPWRA